MFERYTEKARRVIFFARDEASQFGSPCIETEHILLGILREDHFLVHRFELSSETIRKQLEDRVTIREKISTTADLPLSNESKRVLAYAAEEAQRMSERHIGSEHLFLGLLREERGLAADLLRPTGLTLEQARRQISQWPSTESGTIQTRVASHDTQHFSVEVLANGEVLVPTVSFPTLPQTGDEIVLDSPEGPATYRVEAVRFWLDRGLVDNRKLEKIQILVTRV
jgi:ATP-dependent Clp protease ATP-binding subunit ClpC